MRIKNTVISALMGVIIIFFAFAVSWVAENVHTDSFRYTGKLFLFSRAGRQRSQQGRS
ncbi:hypothetical protein HMPREF9156_00509 [Scardovia wiggsiae F0424]|uniref:Uncharacterized protein n=1 Tax=Scardovia wiggsiae F0424 TaxID=857290 RepID=J0D533_9BIFI|nr:hypothetical protein HMPREF9156_00509 [Scardovia wiggsiae F0424]